MEFLVFQYEIGLQMVDVPMLFLDCQNVLDVSLQVEISPVKFADRIFQKGSERKMFLASLVIYYQKMPPRRRWLQQIITNYKSTEFQAFNPFWSVNLWCILVCMFPQCQLWCLWPLDFRGWAPKCPFKGSKVCQFPKRKTEQLEPDNRVVGRLNDYPFWFGALIASFEELSVLPCFWGVWANVKISSDFRFRRGSWFWDMAISGSKHGDSTTRLSECDIRFRSHLSGWRKTKQAYKLL